MGETDKPKNTERSEINGCKKRLRAKMHTKRTQKSKDGKHVKKITN